MPVKTTPSEASRVRVQVLLRDSTSISPACSEAKRCCELSGTYLTLSASFSTAAATARQKSTSRPVHLPWLSAAEKPGPEVLTPQTTWPRALTASSVLPACAVVASPTLAVASAAVTKCLSDIDVSASVDGLASLAILEPWPSQRLACGALVATRRAMNSIGTCAELPPSVCMTNRISSPAIRPR